jgi:prolyl-tRNA editing enzyme YbaK/EbsC (Cys-tRNA(Pro) deacylase)
VSYASPEEVATRVRDEVRRLGVAHEELACDPALADTAAFCAEYGVDEADACNAIVVASKPKGDEPPVACLCLVLATTRLDVNRSVRKLLGVKRASFAASELTRELTGGMEIGGVTPFGLPEGHGLAVYLDSRALERPRLILGGGSRAFKLSLPPASLVALPGLEVIEGLAKEANPS